MKKIFYIISIIFASFSIVSCQKPQVLCLVVEGLKVTITDKDGNDLLSKSSPNYIADKISVTYKGKTYSNMHPTDLGWEMDDVYITLNRDIPNFISITYKVAPQNGDNSISWEKGEQISIAMPDGTKHIISYVGEYNAPLGGTMWLFDGAEELFREYTIVYDPEEQK